MERSLAPWGPSYTPTHLLLTLDLHSVPLLSQQPPEASSHILKRPAENDEIWRLETGASLWPVNGSNLSHLSTTVSLFASCRVSQCSQTIPIGSLIKHSMNSMHCNVSRRFMPCQYKNMKTLTLRTQTSSLAPNKLKLFAACFAWRKLARYPKCHAGNSNRCRGN